MRHEKVKTASQLVGDVLDCIAEVRNGDGLVVAS